MRDALLAVLIGAAFAGCASMPPTESGPVDESQPAPPPLTGAILPANTHITVKLGTALGTETSRRGETFTVTVVEPIIAQNRATVVATGTVVTGMVTGTSPAGADTPAAIRLNFLRVNLEGVTHPFTAEVVRILLPGATEPAAVDETAGPGTALGAVVSGELRDVLVAGGMGVGAGTIVSLGSGADQAVLPAGTRLTIRTVDTLELR